MLVAEASVSEATPTHAEEDNAEATPGKANVDPKDPRQNVLKEYREAWSALSKEQRLQYEEKAAADEQRFRGDLEAWLANQPAGGLGETAEMQQARLAAQRDLKRLGRASKLPTP